MAQPGSKASAVTSCLTNGADPIGWRRVGSITVSLTDHGLLGSWSAAVVCFCFGTLSYNTCLELSVD